MKRKKNFNAAAMAGMEKRTTKAVNMLTAVLLAIAKDYDVCPVCVVQLLDEYINTAIMKGEIGHGPVTENERFAPSDESCFPSAGKAPQGRPH